MTVTNKKNSKPLTHKQMVSKMLKKPAVKAEVNKHLRDFLEEGIEFNKGMDDSNTDFKELEETLFFYPLIGILNNLSSSLSELNPIN
jgi:hypothetical protein